MNRKDVEQRIIEQYQRDERMMALVFAQWCINRGLDPRRVYADAYPDQPANPVLEQVMELTVPPEEAGSIPDETVLGVLSAFGNEELACEVSRILHLPNGT